ncbi:MAG: hypothetical protein KF690_07015 [Bacteroidetes bacterium]|nr:hypothetical protein [Bacteroidota bacterium]
MRSPLSYTLFCLLTLASASPLRAQTISLQDSLPAVPLDTLQLSRTHLVPFSEKVFFGNRLLAPSQYWIDPARGRLVLTDLSLGEGLVMVQARAFRQALPDTLQLLRPTLYKPPPDRNGTFTIDPDSLAHYDTLVTVERAGPATSRLFSDSQLKSRGSISRSLTAGSARDLSVNSAMRLQLEGLVGNDIEVMASVTDENIPIQPDGTTQQISDFDRVSIQLRKQPWNLTLGDYELIERKTRFGNIYRNVLGLNAGFETTRQQANVTLSLSKGRFHTNSFLGENGKQGPYRLQGQENERFIIILAGSEKVYVNGELMTRGQDRDYTIDYNTGELTFTPRRLVTNNYRIVVDFEYAVQSYSRSLLFARYRGQLLDNRLRIALSAGREADNPNSPLFGTLTADERMALRLAGNDPSLAALPGADSVGWSPTDVRYRQLDTLVNGNTYRIFEQSRDSSAALFQVVFSRVGPNKGDYIRTNAGINGNVYRWVAPLPNGTPGGDYAAIRTIPLPRQLQTATVAMEYDLSPALTLFTETAFSNEDLNRLSRRDDERNGGVALYSGLRLKPRKLGSFSLGAEASVQSVDARYQNFDRVYAKEYGRDWDFNDLGQRADERLAAGTLRMGWKDRWRLSLSPGLRQMADSLRTQRQEAILESSDSTLLLGRYQVVWLRTEDNRLHTHRTWLRQNGNISRIIGKFQPGVELWLEDRRIWQGDSLQAGSFRFADWKPYLRSHGWERLSYELSYNFRTDSEFLEGALRDKSLTQTWAASSQWRPGKGLQFTGTLTHNRFRVQDTTFLAQGVRDSETLLAQANASYFTPNQGLYILLLYQILSESVARRDVIFVEVPPGMGQYEWFDYNGDGVQDLNEFELSVNPLIANFQRVLLPSQTLVPAIGLDFSPQLNVDLGKLLHKQTGGLARLLKPLSTTTLLTAQQKTQVPDPQPGDYLISLRPGAAQDTSVLAATLALRQDVYLWRNGPQGDLRVRYASSRNRQFLSSGFEERVLQEWGCYQRKTFSPRHSLENGLETGWKTSYAQLLPGRDYRIDFFRALPQYNWQVSRKLRLSAGYAYQYKGQSTLGTGEEDPARLQSLLNTHKVIFTSRANLKARNNLNLRVELLENQLRGEPGGAVSFELLEGNQPGRNVVWNVLLTQYLSKHLELTVQYDGRASAVAPPLHTGRMQIRAVF